MGRSYRRPTMPREDFLARLLLLGFDRIGDNDPNRLFYRLGFQHYMDVLTSPKDVTLKIYYPDRPETVRKFKHDFHAALDAITRIQGGKS